MIATETQWALEDAELFCQKLRKLSAAAKAARTKEKEAKEASRKARKRLRSAESDLTLASERTTRPADVMAFLREVRAAWGNVDLARAARTSAADDLVVARKRRQEAEDERAAALTRQFERHPLYDSGAPWNAEDGPSGQNGQADGGRTATPEEVAATRPEVLEAEEDHRHRLDRVGLDVLDIAPFWRSRLEAAGLTAVGHLVDLCAKLGKPLDKALEERFAEAGWAPQAPDRIARKALFWLHHNPPVPREGERSCRKCSCTEDDCSTCIAMTGSACQWDAIDPTICTTCAPEAPGVEAALSPPEGEPLPEGLTAAMIERASVCGRFPDHGKVTKPLGVRPVTIDGRQWISTGGGLGGGRPRYFNLLPLLTEADFLERYPGYNFRLAPWLPDNATSEDRRQYYTATKVTVRGKVMVIAPAGEARTFVQTEVR